MSKQTVKEYLSRPAMESIFLQIAKNAVEDAEEAEKESDSLQSELAMQDRSVVAIVMCVQTLEATINVIAKECLSSALWESVEPLNLIGKWLVVTRLYSGKDWDRGKQPFQDFAEVVKLRNKLVHYKPQYEEKSEATAQTDFADQFTGALARKYFDATCTMIAEFFGKAGEEVPPSLQPANRTRGQILINSIP